MIMFGVVLLVIGFVAHIPIVWSIGVIVLVVGWSFGSSGQWVMPWEADATTTNADQVQGKVAPRRLDACTGTAKTGE